MTPEPARTPRGERRRRALVDAAAAVLADEGFDALTHRAVAARAGLPLAATTYYFGSRDDLTAAALGRLLERHMARARRRARRLPAAPAPPDEAARALVAVVSGGAGQRGRGALLTFYERYAQAGRRPQLRGPVRAANEELTGLLAECLGRMGHPADPDLARLVMAAADGLLLAGLVEGAADPAEDAAGGVARILAGAAA